MPSFLPLGPSSSSPTHEPAAKSVFPQYLTCPGVSSQNESQVTRDSRTRDERERKKESKTLETHGKEEKTEKLPTTATCKRGDRAQPSTLRAQYSIAPYSVEYSSTVS